jgi:chemotaxis protein CheD
MKVSAEQEDRIVTHALGSCLGIAVYDPVAHVGGLLHVMLPLSTIDPEKAKSNPFVFVDTGVPRLFIECYKMGAQKQRVIVKVAGGASLRSEEDDDYFQIGKRNFVMLRKLLWKNNVMIDAYEVGGAESRTMAIDIETGIVTIKSNGESKEI